MARSGDINGVIGAFHGDAPDFIYPKNEQAILKNSFYVLKDNMWNFESIKSLEKIILGCIKGYAYGDLLSKYINNAPKSRVVSISGDNNLNNRLSLLLEKKRVDVIVEADLVFQYEMKKLLKHNSFRHAGNASEPMGVYIAFSPNHRKSLEYSKILSDGMEDIRRSGQLEIIKRKYGIAD